MRDEEQNGRSKSEEIEINNGTKASNQRKDGSLTHPRNARDVSSYLPASQDEIGLLMEGNKVDGRIRGELATGTFTYVVRTEYGREVALYSINCYFTFLLCESVLKAVTSSKKRLATRSESGFAKAHSDDLPKIDVFLMTSYLAKSSDFKSVELRGVKAARWVTVSQPIKRSREPSVTDTGPTSETTEKSVRQDPWAASGDRRSLAVIDDEQRRHSSSVGARAAGQRLAANSKMPHHVPPPLTLRANWFCVQRVTLPLTGHLRDRGISDSLRCSTTTTRVTDSQVITRFNGRSVSTVVRDHVLNALVPLYQDRAGIPRYRVRVRTSKSFEFYSKTKALLFQREFQRGRLALADEERSGHSLTTVSEEKVEKLKKHMDHTENQLVVNTAHVYPRSEESKLVTVLFKRHTISLKIAMPYLCGKYADIGCTLDELSV
ncbi:hypothetical protein EVAR_7175_1 [Eumeta japonica]|uniref:Uncharacterized protein n=1 Tax=Eumeta variegata TaxID=151549 RepID=A0A4C1U6N8_EUMVA|nr:hypothetical protein EVAR_7175_1 [Eumeta japonica]